MSITRMSHVDFAAQVNLTLTNVTNHPETLQRLAEWEYTSTEFEEIKEMLGEFRGEKRARVDAIGVQKTNTERLNEMRADFTKNVYTKHVRAARAILRRDTGALSRLGLHEARKRAFYPWLSQARTFYENALEQQDLLDRLSARGLNQQRLAHGLQRVAMIETVDAEQEASKGEAQQTTRNRDELREPLQKWYLEFSDIARGALADKPEWLERLGIFQAAPDTSAPNRAHRGGAEGRRPFWWGSGRLRELIF